MPFASELEERLRFEVVLVFERPPLGVGDGRRHDGHHLVLFPLEVRQQELGEVVERGHQPIVVSIGIGAIEPGGGRGFHLGDRRSDRLVIGVHRIEQICGGGVSFSHQRVKPVILGAVVGAQEGHHPDEVTGDRLLLLERWGWAAGQCCLRSTQVASQRLVNDAHHARVGWCVRRGGHRGSLLLLEERGTTRSNVWAIQASYCSGVQPDSSTSKR